MRKLLGLAVLALFSFTLEEENRNIEESSKRIESIYDLGEDNWRDVTDKVLSNPETPQKSKEDIQAFHRRIIIFKYPSDGIWVKGFFSYTPNPNHHPLLILFRWGNMNFALMNPGVELATYRNYSVLSSTLRGGVSEGKDEFGGADVNDMKNLIDFLPRLAEELGIQLHPPCIFMLGPSRGGLEMFLTLSRFPELQNKVNKVVALSAILDLHRLIKDRPEDMGNLLRQQFGLEKGAKGEAWIAKRDPLNSVPYLKPSLPILIVQGTADTRVNIAEGRRMVETLKQSGRSVEYWEIPKGDHVLMNTPYLMNDVVHWLEANSTCQFMFPEKGTKKHTDDKIGETSK